MKIQTDAPAVAAASAPQEGDWDEEQLQTALRKLKELHIKLRDIRSAIPRMIQPFSGQLYSSPDELFSACQAAMVGAVKEVKEFRDLFTGDEAKTIMDHASASRKKQPTGIKPWRASQEPDWATLDTTVDT